MSRASNIRKRVQNLFHRKRSVDDEENVSETNVSTKPKMCTQSTCAIQGASDNSKNSRPLITIKEAKTLPKQYKHGDVTSKMPASKNEINSLTIKKSSTTSLPKEKPSENTFSVLLSQRLNSENIGDKNRKKEKENKLSKCENDKKREDDICSGISETETKIENADELERITSLPNVSEECVIAGKPLSLLDPHESKEKTNLIGEGIDASLSQDLSIDCSVHKTESDVSPLPAVSVEVFLHTKSLDRTEYKSEKNSIVENPFPENTEIENEGTFSQDCKEENCGVSKDIALSKTDETGLSKGGSKVPIEIAKAIKSLDEIGRIFDFYDNEIESMHVVADDKERKVLTSFRSNQKICESAQDSFTPSTEIVKNETIFSDTVEKPLDYGLREDIDTLDKIEVAKENENVVIIDSNKVALDDDDEMDVNVLKLGDNVGEKDDAMTLNEDPVEINNDLRKIDDSDEAKKDNDDVLQIDRNNDDMSTENEVKIKDIVEIYDDDGIKDCDNAVKRDDHKINTDNEVVKTNEVVVKIDDLGKIDDEVEIEEDAVIIDNKGVNKNEVVVRINDDVDKKDDVTVKKEDFALDKFEDVVKVLDDAVEMVCNQHQNIDNMPSNIVEIKDKTIESQGKEALNHQPIQINTDRQEHAPENETIIKELDNTSLNTKDLALNEIEITDNNNFADSSSIALVNSTNSHTEKVRAKWQILTNEDIDEKIIGNGPFLVNYKVELDDDDKVKRPLKEEISDEITPSVKLPLKSGPMKPCEEDEQELEELEAEDDDEEDIDKLLEESIEPDVKLPTKEEFEESAGRKEMFEKGVAPEIAKLYRDDEEEDEVLSETGMITKKIKYEIFQTDELSKSFLDENFKNTPTEQQIFNYLQTKNSGIFNNMTGKKQAVVLTDNDKLVSNTFDCVQKYIEKKQKDSNVYHNAQNIPKILLNGQALASETFQSVSNSQAFSETLGEQQEVVKINVIDNPIADKRSKSSMPKYTANTRKEKLKLKTDLEENKGDTQSLFGATNHASENEIQITEMRTKTDFSMDKTQEVENKERVTEDIAQAFQEISEPTLREINGMEQNEMQITEMRAKTDFSMDKTQEVESKERVTEYIVQALQEISEPNLQETSDMEQKNTPENEIQITEMRAKTDFKMDKTQEVENEERVTENIAQAFQGLSEPNLREINGIEQKDFEKVGANCLEDEKCFNRDYYKEVNSFSDENDDEIKAKIEVELGFKISDDVFESNNDSHDLNEEYIPPNQIDFVDKTEQNKFFEENSETNPSNTASSLLENAFFESCITNLNNESEVAQNKTIDSEDRTVSDILQKETNNETDDKLKESDDLKLINDDEMLGKDESEMESCLSSLEPYHERGYSCDYSRHCNSSQDIVELLEHFDESFENLLERYDDMQRNNQNNSVNMNDNDEDDNIEGDDKGNNESDDETNEGVENTRNDKILNEAFGISSTQNQSNTQAKSTLESNEENSNDICSYKQGSSSFAESAVDKNSTEKQLDNTKGLQNTSEDKNEYQIIKSESFKKEIALDQGKENYKISILNPTENTENDIIIGNVKEINNQENIIDRTNADDIECKEKGEGIKTETNNIVSEQIEEQEVEKSDEIKADNKNHDGVDLIHFNTEKSDGNKEKLGDIVDDEVTAKDLEGEKDGTVDVCGLLDVFQLKTKITDEQRAIDKSITKLSRKEHMVDRLQDYLQQLKSEKEKLAEMLERLSVCTLALNTEAMESRKGLSEICDATAETIGRTTQARCLEPTCYRRYLGAKNMADVNSLLSAIRNREKALKDLEILTYRKQLVMQHGINTAPIIERTVVKSSNIAGTKAHSKQTRKRQQKSRNSQQAPQSLTTGIKHREQIAEPNGSSVVVEIFMDPTSSQNPNDTSQSESQGGSGSHPETTTGSTPSTTTTSNADASIVSHENQVVEIGSLLGCFVTLPDSEV